MSHQLTITEANTRVEVAESNFELTVTPNETTIVFECDGDVELSPVMLTLQLAETSTTLTLSPSGTTVLEVSTPGPVGPTGPQGPAGSNAPARLFFTTQAGATQENLTPASGADTAANFMQLNNPDTSQGVFEMFVWSP